MKTGRTLEALAAELTRQAGAKRDFVAPAAHLHLAAQSNEIVLSRSTTTSVGAFAVTPHTHRQIGTWAGVPAKYYDRLRNEAPELLNANVNHWFAESNDARMLRTLDGKARAFVSDRFQCIDNYDIAEKALTVAHERGLRAVSTEITDSKLYLKFVSDEMKADVKVGDTVQAGVVVTNGEIGNGAAQVQGFIHRLWCLNGCYTHIGMRRNHVGRRLEVTEGNYEIFADDTRAADNTAVLLKLRDTMAASFDETRFKAEVERFAATQDDAIETSPVKAVEELANKFAFNETERDGILSNLLKDQEMNGLSRFGMINAVTRTAQDVASYDRSDEMEAVGGKLLNLEPAQWRELSQAA